MTASSPQLPRADTSHSLGVNALLDELLADVPGKDLAMTPMREGDEQESGVGLAEPMTTPRSRSRQIAELCGEMDSCLAALDRMEESNRLKQQAVRKEMEAEESILTSPISPMLEGDSLADAYYQASVSPSRSVAAQLPMPTAAAGSPTVLSASLQALQDDEELLRQSDEERIARLRNEVEGLRVREAQQHEEILQHQHLLDVMAMDEASLRAASEVEAVPSEIRSADLSALVAEADDVLADFEAQFPGAGGGGVAADLQQLGQAGPLGTLERLELRLGQASRGLGHMEGALDSELHELEKILAAQTQNDPDEPDHEAIPC